MPPRPPWRSHCRRPEDVGPAIPQDVTEDGIKCLHHGGADPWPLATSCAIEVSFVGKSVERGVERIADVDDDLAREGVSVLGDDRNDSVAEQGRDDNAPGGDGAPRVCRRTAAQSLGQAIGLGLIASHDLDGIAAGHCACRW